MKRLLFASTALAIMAGGSQAFAAACSGAAFGAAALGPDLCIVLNSNGTGTISAGPSAGLAGGTYDGSDDVYIGVVNSSGRTVSAITVSGSAAIYGFDGDGIDTYGAIKAPGNPDTTGYGGPITSFSGINAGLMSGTETFLGGLANGGTTFFSLELPPGSANFVVSGVPEPATWAMMLLGFVGLAFGFRQSRRRVSVA
jgi:hypothetical protein